MKKNILMLGLVGLFATSLFANENHSEEQYLVDVEIAKVIDGEESELISSSTLLVDGSEKAHLTIGTKEANGETKEFEVDIKVDDHQSADAQSGS